MSKVFAVSVELDDPEDVESAQVRYLDNILREAEPPKLARGFSFRFQYDVDGTSHWNGDLYVVEVADGDCVLRHADADDAGGRPTWWEQRELRRAKYLRPQAAPGSKPARVAIRLEASWRDLDGTKLREAFDLLKVAMVMGS